MIIQWLVCLSVLTLFSDQDFEDDATCKTDYSSSKYLKIISQLPLNDELNDTNMSMCNSAFLSVRLHLQVPGRSRKHVWRESPQHPLEAVSGATGQPAHGRPSCGRTSHFIHGRHQWHTNHAALDCEYTADTLYT